MVAVMVCEGLRPASNGGMATFPAGIFCYHLNFINIKHRQLCMFIKTSSDLRFWLLNFHSFFLVDRFENQLVCDKYPYRNLRTSCVFVQHNI